MSNQGSKKDANLDSAFANFANMILRPTSNFQGTVSAVDEVKFTATVKAGGSTYYEVPLRVLISAQATIIEIPKIGTSAILCFRNVNLQTPQILMIHQAEKLLIKCDHVIFNDGALGGMVKAKVLKEQSNKDKDVLTALLTIINGAPINEPGGGAPSALQIALKAALTGKQPGTWDDLENPKITQ